MSATEQILLRTIPVKHLVLDVRDVNGASSGRNGSIENTRPDEFAAAVAEHLRYWERFDVAFQIKEGFRGTFDPGIIECQPLYERSQDADLDVSGLTAATHTARVNRWVPVLCHSLMIGSLIVAFRSAKAARLLRSERPRCRAVTECAIP